MKQIDLNGQWRFKAEGGRSNRVRQWMDAEVPGTVHTDLMRNGKIPDPFYRMQERDVQWVESEQWVYRRTFVVPKDLLKETVVELVAMGLDTVASVSINGKPAGRSANMFVEHRFDVKRLLRAGKNTIEMRFDSPVQWAKRLERKHGPLRVALEAHRVYIRKAQYSFSWDWGPKLTTSGIWRPIRLEAHSVARLADPFVKVLSADKKEAIVVVSANVVRRDAGPLRVSVEISGGSEAVNIRRTVRGNRFSARLRLPRPDLWWPNGYGEQPMYLAHIALEEGGEVLQAVDVPFGIRTVRLLQEKDSQGSSFVIEVNGAKIFCKGADWIPSDSFIPRLTEKTYGTLLSMAKDAHMNMLRVWGGGIYEEDLFYDLCDRLGLMVWQDFMFACGEYPEQQPFIQNVKSEAEKAVARLRNHPSLVVWCGNNECEWLFCSENPSKTADQMTGAPIFRDLLPAVCRRLDGTRPYWRSSPFGKGSPNDESNGNHHQWVVWSAWNDFKKYEQDNARFVTEFGFQAPAHAKTMARVMLPADCTPQSAVMEHHNKQEEGTERLFRFQAAHYRVGDTFEDFVYKGQLVQAEALKCAVEHWRRRKFDTAGSLFWQLNDCWPVSSWSVIDSDLRPKAGYFYAKRFFSPVLVSIKRAGRGVQVWLTSDLLQPVRGELTVELLSFTGKVEWKKRANISMAANASRRVLDVAEREYTSFPEDRHYLLATFESEGVILSENRFFFVEPKHFRLPAARPHASVRWAADVEGVLVLRAAGFVKNLFVDLPGAILEDNFVDLDGGRTREFRFRSSARNKLLVPVLHWLH